MMHYTFPKINFLNQSLLYSSSTAKRHHNRAFKISLHFENRGVIITLCMYLISPWPFPFSNYFLSTSTTRAHAASPIPTPLSPCTSCITSTRPARASTPCRRRTPRASPRSRLTQQGNQVSQAPQRIRRKPRRRETPLSSAFAQHDGDRCQSQQLFYGRSTT